MHPNGQLFKEQLEALGPKVEGPVEIPYGYRLDVYHGAMNVNVNIFDKNGRCVVQGPESELKTLVQKVCDALMKGEPFGQVVSADELNAVVPVLQEHNVDEVVVQYIDEAVRAVRNGLVLAPMFLLGGASERMLRLLMEDVVQAFPDRPNLRGRLLEKGIADAQANLLADLRGVRKEFKTGLPPEWENTLRMCDYYRRTRNAVGHPDGVVGLDVPGVRLVVFTARDYFLTLQSMRVCCQAQV